jgi:hypothetical protein
VLTHILVHETRLSAGIEDKPATELRGSYRALSFAKRCGRVDYAGLDGPAKKKRKRGKKSSNATEIPNVFFRTLPNPPSRLLSVGNLFVVISATPWQANFSTYY